MHQTLRDLLAQARQDAALKERLYRSRESHAPYKAFCQAAAEAGFPMTVDELIACGEEYSDNMLKSCNGGATYPFDYLDDAYGLFFAALD